MRDEVFGELNYEFGWNGTVDIDWFGNTKRVDLMISGEEEDEISDYQRECFTALSESWADVINEVVEEILTYYQNLREELGYEGEENPEYPMINDISELLEHISLDQIIMNEEGVFDGRFVGLAFSCDWDDENSVGVLLIDEKVNQVGYQDIVF